jgi:hypothetical protein
MKQKMYREPFLMINFLVLDTIFWRKSLELAKIYNLKNNFTQWVTISSMSRPDVSGCGKKSANLW